jgi:hypothetical protein
MGKIGAVVLAIIAILLILGALGVSLGSIVDKWALPILVAIWAITKVIVNFKK